MYNHASISISLTWCCTFHISRKKFTKINSIKLTHPINSLSLAAASPEPAPQGEVRLEVRLAAALRQEQEVSQGGQHHQQHVLKIDGKF